jgi:rSAM/selenodomain-associated transferase 2
VKPLANNPRCSIVIPVLNDADALQCTVAQLQSLRASSVEIIVVDGGSDKNNLVILDQYVAPFVDHFLCASRGRALQMNAGAAVAKSDYLLFLHADTILPASFLSLLSRWIDTSVVWGFFRPKLSGEHKLLRWIERGMYCRSRLTAVATGDQVLFVRRDVFDRVGGFPSIPLMEDVAMSKCLRRVAAPFVCQDAVITSSRRWEQRGIIKTILLMWSLRFLYVVGVSPQTLGRWYYGK